MDTAKGGPFELVSSRLGAVPLVNHFLDRIGPDALLARWLPEPDRRFRLIPAVAIRLVVINLLVGRSPLYGLGEWAAPYAPGLLGLPGADTGWLNDDRVGRALVTLFDADRASLLTELIVGVVAEFNVDTAEMHNDSTSVSVHGQYTDADGGPRRGKPTPEVTFGHSKDHRPDLKQLVFILTVSADVAVPMAYRLADGGHHRRPDPRTTWDALVKVLDRRDFLYVADSKLCSGTAMRHIDGEGGRFVTVMPRTRGEDKWFRDWIQTNQPRWTEAIRLPGERIGDLDRVYSVFPAPLPSAEGYRIIWVHSTAKAARDAHTRRSRIQAGVAAIDALSAKLAGPKTRLKTRTAVEQTASKALAEAGAARWLDVTVTETIQETFRQEKRGRPGADTRYRRATRTNYTVNYQSRDDIIAYDAASDGCFPPHHQRPPPLRRGRAHRVPVPAQPRTPPPPAQVRPGRRPAMATRPRPHRSDLLLPVPRPTRRRAHRAPDPHRHAHRQHGRHPALPRTTRLPPSTERIIEVFADLTRHELHRNGHLVQTFEPHLSPLQQQILDLLGIPTTAYTTS